MCVLTKYSVYASVSTMFDTTIHLQLTHTPKQNTERPHVFKAGYDTMHVCITTFLPYRISIGGNKGVMDIGEINNTYFVIRFTPIQS